MTIDRIRGILIPNSKPVYFFQTVNRFTFSRLSTRGNGGENMRNNKIQVIVVALPVIIAGELLVRLLLERAAL